MSNVVGIRLKLENGKFGYEFYPVEFSSADKEGIIHGIVFCLVLKPSGKILRIKRSKDNYLFKNYNSIPAGHIDFGMEPHQTALSELEEETKLKPIICKRIFSDIIFLDEFGHFAFVYLFVADEKNKPVFDAHEINIKESGFEKIEDLIKKLETEKFTPLSRMILMNFIKKYPTTKKLKEYIKENLE